MYVNAKAELVPSPRAYARNGAPRRWLGDNKQIVTALNILIMFSLVGQNNSLFTKIKIS